MFSVARASLAAYELRRCEPVAPARVGQRFLRAAHCCLDYACRHSAFFRRNTIVHDNSHGSSNTAVSPSTSWLIAGGLRRSVRPHNRPDVIRGQNK